MEFQYIPISVCYRGMYKNGSLLLTFWYMVWVNTDSDMHVHYWITAITVHEKYMITIASLKECSSHLKHNINQRAKFKHSCLFSSDVNKIWLDKPDCRYTYQLSSVLKEGKYCIHTYITISCSNKCKDSIIEQINGCMQKVISICMHIHKI